MVSLPIRREPPAFRPVEVVDVRPISPFMVRVTFGGAELAGFDCGLPGSSMRLLLPELGHAEEIPVWNGNEFLLADGSRPTIRTLTPLRFDSEALHLEADIVLHGESPLSDWARSVAVGAEVAVAGTGRGYAIPEDAKKFLLVGDESAIPAIGLLLAKLPQEITVRVIIEINDPRSQIDLPSHSNADIAWRVLPVGSAPGSAVHAEVVANPPDEECHVWAAGEASAVHRLRSYLFGELGLSRSKATVRGYWKLPRR